MLGSPSGNVGIIQGGVQVNFVPDRCFIEIDRRMLPGESVENVLLGYQSIVDQIQQAEPKARFDMEPPMLIDPAMATDPNASVATCTQRTLYQLGREANFFGVPFGSDASKLSRQGIPSVIIGPGSIDQAHAAIEYVELDQVELAFEFYRRFLLNFE
jgi:acetylornithine deacetylase